jgi:hypothetical protein
MKQITFILLFMAFIVLNTKGQTGGMIVAPGTTVTQEQGSTIDITAGHLLLQDDYDNAPSFIQKGSVTYTGGGDSEVEQYLTKDRWHMVSSPVQNEVNGAYMWIYLYEYSEPDNSFDFLNLPTTQPLNPGQGYFAWSYTTDPNGQWPSSPDFVLLNGTLNSQNVNLSLSVTASSPKSGWNLVGNPYPCGLEWNGNSDWNLQNLDASVWIWDPVAGNYKVWNYNSGGTLQSGEIASTQGFWVHATDTTGATATSMTLPASQRVHTTNDFYKSSGPFIAEQLKLKVQGNTMKNDETVIGFHSGASALPNNQLDALYLEGDEDAPSLFVRLDGYSYAMKQLPDIEKYNAVPVSFISPLPGVYSITASWIESFPTETEIWIEDLKTGYWQDLKNEPEYTFAAEFNDSHERFIVHFGTQLGEQHQNNDGMINIFAFDKKVFVNISFDDFVKGRCVIFDMAGRIVAKREVEYGKNIINASFTNGFYVVTVNTGRRFYSEKAYIN